MSESAVTGEAEGGAMEAAQDIEIRSLGGQRQHSCGKRGLAIESGAVHAGASQEVSNGVESVFGLRRSVFGFGFGFGLGILFG